MNTIWPNPYVRCQVWRASVVVGERFLAPPPKRFGAQEASFLLAGFVSSGSYSYPCVSSWYLSTI